MHSTKKIIITIKEENNEELSKYEKLRLVFQVIQIIITLGVPFIVVWINKNW